MRHIEEKLYYTPNDFSAESDSSAIQAAVDTAVNEDIRRVVIPRENIRTGKNEWHLENTVCIPDGMTLIFDGAAVFCDGIGFANKKALESDSGKIGDEQKNIFLIGRNGACLYGKEKPQIFLHNVQKYRIDGLKFSGGSGISAVFTRHGRLLHLQFDSCTYGIVLGEGSRNLIVENISGETKCELLKLCGGNETMMGREPDIRDIILCRLLAKTNCQKAVGIYPDICKIFNIVVRDLTDKTPKGTGVCIGKYGFGGEIRDITVRGVKADKVAVETSVACDGMYYSSLFAEEKLVCKEKNTRELLDDDESEIVLPEFPSVRTDLPFLTPNSPEFFGQSDSETIQNTIDESEKKGINRVVIPRINLRTGESIWNIGKTIVLPSNMTLELWGCHLRLEDFCYCGLITNRDYLSEKHSTESEDCNITVTGVGDCVLDGGNHNGLLEKTSRKNGYTIVRNNTLLPFGNVSGIKIENLFITHTRYYGISFHSCDHGLVSDIDYYCRELVPNLDGIDLRTGCHHFTVQNITGTLADDVVAMNVLGGNWVGFPVEGKEPHTHHITVRNIMADACRWYSVRLLNHDGNLLQDIVIDTIIDASLTELKKQPQAVISVGCPEYYKFYQSKLGDLDRITIRDIYSRSERVIDLGGCSRGVSVRNAHSYGDGMYWIVDIRISAETENFYGKGWFYRPEQKSLYLTNDDGAFSDKSKYRGVLFNLVDIKGHNVVFEDIFADKCKSVAWVIGNADVELKNLNVNEHRDDVPGYFCSKDSVLKVNGKIIPTSDSIPVEVFPIITKWKFK